MILLLMMTINHYQKQLIVEVTMHRKKIKFLILNKICIDRNIAEAQAIFGDDFTFNDIDFNELNDEMEDEDLEDDDDEEDVEDEEVEPEYDEDGNLIEDVKNSIKRKFLII
jgi:hypothetical protein